MKKTFLFTALLTLMGLSVQAQKFALVDMEYIMSNIPAYEQANEQLNQTSRKWQAEVEAIENEAKTLYKNYQDEAPFLTAEQKKAREQAIIDKEKEATDLRKKYFAPQGELYKKRISLIEPIQTDIYNAVKSIAQSKNFQLIIDRASDSGVIFASPSIDISNEVLQKMGYTVR
ncbi:MAG: OmpH family outer membrane protein [Bacteroidaceae bacterium]|nr:OmpH family outer membrane protein [Bacteroidaceae bacterium]